MSKTERRCTMSMLHLDEDEPPQPKKQGSIALIVVTLVVLTVATVAGALFQDKILALFAR